MKVLCLVLAVCTAANAGIIAGGYSAAPGYGAAYSGGYGRAQGGQVVLVAAGGAQGGASGSSLTVAGPSHVIKTIHQVRTIDQGGEILAKTGGSQTGIARILIVNNGANGGAYGGGAAGLGGHAGHAVMGWW